MCLSGRKYLGHFKLAKMRPGHPPSPQSLDPSHPLLTLPPSVSLSLLAFGPSCFDLTWLGGFEAVFAKPQATRRTIHQTELQDRTGQMLQDFLRHEK